MTAIADADQRRRATEPQASFCVSAPAGSGKTELLIQRFLRLLGCVQRPEQVLAITFTRKAAAEMRERVLEALRAASLDVPCRSPHEQVTREFARQALLADDRGQWQLLHNTARLNIKTIDSFCLALTRQMPVLSHFGGDASPENDTAPLYQEAVGELFTLLDTDHGVAGDLRALLGHFDNDWQLLQTLLVQMLGKRAQWRWYVGVRESPEEAETYLRAAITGLVEDHLQMLDAQLSCYRNTLLPLQRYAARQLALPEPLRWPEPVAAELPAWLALCELLMTKEGGWRRRVDKRQGFPPAKAGEARARKDELLALLAQFEGMPEMAAALAAVRELPEMEAGSTSWQLVVHLSRLLPVLAAQLLLTFRRHGVVDYEQISQSAMLALGDDERPTDLALRLDYCLEHILVDEFQDTAINQFELLHKLTRGWGEHNAQHPETPRTLLIVGDAMQSIYGFRDANVGLFLRARDEGFNGVTLEHLQLRCNFRSDPALVEWVNRTFAAAFPQQEDISTAQVRYQAAQPVRTGGADLPVSLEAFCGAQGRTAEVDALCARIAQYVAAGERRIAVLGRQRRILQPIARRLQALGVPCYAEELTSLARAPAARDLHSLTRALCNDGDRLAWLSILRAPWCGLALHDLLAVARHGEPRGQLPLRVAMRCPELLEGLSADGRARLSVMGSVLAEARRRRDRLGLRAWLEQAWVDLGGPGSLADPMDLQDAERYLQLLEQAEGEGRGADIDWLERQLATRHGSGGDPDSPVQLLTLHKAKGLEFDRVFLPALDARPRRNQSELLLWDEHMSRRGTRSFLLAAIDRGSTSGATLYNYLKQRRRLKQQLEDTRLLYVGATRAIHRLHLSAVIDWDADAPEQYTPPATSLLATIWPDFAAQMTVHDLPGTTAPADPVPPPLLRVVRSQLPPIAAVQAAGLPEGNFPEAAAHAFERSVGVVVHRALEELSRMSPLPAAMGARDGERWRAALAESGLVGTALADAEAIVAEAAGRALAAGSAGRWLLDQGHAHARSEWRLRTVTANGRREMVIDRAFVEKDSGVRWLIDYKTARPGAGEALLDFYAREEAEYRAQLMAYRDVLRELGPEPIRCALYFTALGELRELPELALSPASAGVD